MGVKRKITKSTNQSLSIQDAFDEYVEAKKSMNVSVSTIKNLSFSINKWMKYLTENGYSMSVDDITQKYMFAFQTHCLENNMKATTLNHYIREIRAFIYWLVEQEYLDKGFKIKQVAQQDEIKETYTDEEKMKLVAKPSKNANNDFVEWRSWAIVNWILATGHRAGTVCSIKLGDVSYTNKEIYVRQTKTNKAYITPLSKELSVVIKEYVRRWRANATNDEYLFCNVGGEQLTVNALKHSITKYNQSRGVNKISVHALRHTFARDWIRSTGDVFRLQKLLGHSSLEMTRRYVNLFNEDLKEGFSDYNPLDRLKRMQTRTKTVKRTD